MPAATLYRSVYRSSTSRLDPEPRYLGEEVVFHGDLAEALSIAKALPLTERVDATLETEHGDFHSSDFDRLDDEWSPTDKDFAHGSLTIRVTGDALLRMHGDSLRYLRSAMLLDDHLDEIRAIIQRKIAAGEITEHDGKRVVMINATELA